mgnify:CR=1 FL=1
MKKMLLIASITGASFSSISQVNWQKGGNGVAGGTNSSLGTNSTWNAPLYFQTFGTNRMKLNGSFTAAGASAQYGIDGYTTFGTTNTTVNTSGYLLLGASTNFQTQPGQNIYTNKGAFSLLHLNGNSLIQQNGYRPWMKTGITFTDNQDLSYFGLRQIGNALDWTETVIVWTDNQTLGADEMAFRFNGGSTSSTAIDNNLRSNTDLDDLHVARYSADGRYALGNTFGYNTAPGHPTTLYVRPQSLFHMSYDRQNGQQNEAFGFMQITTRDPNILIGTGETEQDGLRFGIDNDIINLDGINHLSGYLRWQENSPFIIQSDWDNTAGGIQNGERMRITSIAAPGVIDPAMPLDNNLTRVAISHHGSEPITNPRSLLHLGYNTSTNVLLGQVNDGWRNWMDVGTFTNIGSDNMYVGMKHEGNDRYDAVINWGDNQVPGISPNGPDKLRFIFTSTTTALPPGEGNAVSQSNNGLEVGRFYPAYDTTFTYLLGDSTDFYGRFGVGDFTSQGVNEEPTHKLDVVGNGRFRFLPDSIYMADTLVNKYVMVDSMGVLRWTSQAPSSFGVECSDSVNGKLTFDSKIDLNNHNFYFVNNDSLSMNHVGIGYECGDSLLAKLSVLQTHPSSVNQSTISVSGINIDTANVISLNYVGVQGRSIGQQPPFFRIRNIGGDFYGESADLNFGVIGTARAGGMPNSFNTGGQFVASSGNFSTGVHGQGDNAEIRNIGISGIGTSPFNPSSLENIGGQFVGAYSNGSNYGVRGVANFGTTAIGIYGTASGASVNNYAGYFDGDVYISGGYGPSDEMLKENIMEISGADALLSQLNPVTFDFKTAEFPRFNLSSENQMGLIAQEVEQVLPSIVKLATSPAVFDSLGNELEASIEFKTIDYSKLIPLLVAGHKEQTEKIDSLQNSNDSLQAQLTNLNDRLTQLENCLSNLLPALCQANQMAIQQTPQETQEYLEKTINITLSNRNNIILNQNVPNPFAESTVISYSIPSTVQKAQIHFYDGQGKLINTVEISERGNGQLNVFANDLSAGVYTYSLVADGQIIATKRMMKQ